MMNNTNNDVQRGFDQQATTSQISQLQTQVGQGFADNAVAQCQGNANITAAITNAQFATAQAIGGAKDTIALGFIGNIWHLFVARIFQIEATELEFGKFSICWLADI